ncbi:MAG: hypothetical protein GX801_06655 [Fibrobacter sp.]|nr:hypothetical protein [Fibrobacter sp.]
MGSLNYYYRSKNRPKKPKFKFIKWINRVLLIVVIALATYFCQKNQQELDNTTPISSSSETKNSSSIAVSSSVIALKIDTTSLPQRKVVDIQKPSSPLNLYNQKDTVLAKHIRRILQQQKPFGAFILMVDAPSNEILAWGQRSDSALRSEPLWLTRSTFPAASIIKILTAATAMETRRYGINNEIPIIGRSNTLYLRQLRIPENYQGPKQTLMQAFALSSNPVMGIIGQHLGGNSLRRHARYLGFNQTIPFGLSPHGQSIFAPPDTGYAVAKCASGFTKANTI